MMVMMNSDEVIIPEKSVLYVESVVESNCGTDVILRIYEFTEIQ